jgi:hypothetical protein
VPDAHDVEVHQYAERERRGHLDVLRGQERAAAVVTVGQHTANEREEHDRQLLKKGIDAQPECRAGDREYQPVLGDALHPGADARGARTQPENAEVAIGKGRGDAPEDPVTERWGESLGRFGSEWFNQRSNISQGSGFGTRGPGFGIGLRASGPILGSFDPEPEPPDPGPLPDLDLLLHFAYSSESLAKVGEMWPFLPPELTWRVCSASENSIAR